MFWFKETAHPKRIAPSPSCGSKPVRPSLVFRTQMKIFLMKLSDPAQALWFLTCSVMLGPGVVLQVVGLNFSSATTPELLLKTFDHYCEYRRTPNGVVLAPVQLGKWLVLFCDEINLPDMDKYGTQRVISFIRQVCVCVCVCVCV